MTEAFYSTTYKQARSRFVESATAVGAKLSKHVLEIEDAAADEFAIDVATLGPENAPTLVVSSGLHGVEGFLGSAIQLAVLDQFEIEKALNIRWVLIHAINPFGFARIRRFNEENVDLNRNFLLPDSPYTGSPTNYDRLNTFLNPASKPSSFEPFRLKAMWNIARYGMAALKQSIAAGQYEYPHGIFYGGAEPSQSMKVIYGNCEQWVGSTQKTLHVDFHSGLGNFGEYKLMLAEFAGSEKCKWYENVFGRDFIEPLDAAAYMATGTLGQWLQHHYADRDYRFVTAEFGTYGPIRILAALRAENRAHHFENPQSENYRNAKLELKECFCPADAAWRQQAVTAGLNIIRQGVRGLMS